jgi:hypothetical protein
MEAALSALRAYQTTEVAHLREMAQTLAATEAGGWWRLRARLLPPLRLASRLTRRQRR